MTDEQCIACIYEWTSTEPPDHMQMVRAAMLGYILASCTAPDKQAAMIARLCKRHRAIGDMFYDALMDRSEEGKTP